MIHVLYRYRNDGCGYNVRANEAGFRSVDSKQLAEATLLLCRDEDLARKRAKGTVRKRLKDPFLKSWREQHARSIKICWLKLVHTKPIIKKHNYV